MIGKLGLRRFIVIVLLALILGVFFAADNFFLTTEEQKSRSELSGLNAEISVLEGELEKMRADYQVFQKQKMFFDSISKMGFFNDQDRVIARERFDTMQRLSKIISARYEIKAAKIIADETASTTGFVIMESPITVSLSAVDDLDVYRFIYYLNYGFPGHVAINSLRVERNMDITSDVIKQIGVGAPPEIISASLELDWRTMARKESIASDTLNPYQSDNEALQEQ